MAGLRVTLLNRCRIQSLSSVPWSLTSIHHGPLLSSAAPVPLPVLFGVHISARHQQVEHPILFPHSASVCRVVDFSTDVHAMGFSAQLLVNAICRKYTPGEDRPAYRLLMELQRVAQWCTMPCPAQRPTAKQVHTHLAGLLA